MQRGLRVITLKEAKSIDIKGSGNPPVPLHKIVTGVPEKGFFINIYF